MFALALILGACTLTATVDPQLECTNTCESEQEDCVTVCKQECVDAGGEDSDSVCDEDCDTTCGEEYDTCTVRCTSTE